MTSDQREKKPLSCGTAQNISHLRLRYPLGTWNTRVSRRFGRIRELPLLLASRLQGQDPPSLGWTYYDSLGPASDGPARLDNMRGTSFVAAALNEQKKLNLPWYAKLKPLLEIDELFSKNHVSAYQTLNPKSKILCPSTNNAINISSLNNNTINLHPMKSRKFRTLKIADSLKNWFTVQWEKHKMHPMKSRKFRTWKIADSLKNWFTVQWEKHKSTSPKLIYYNSIKSVYEREPYLDQ